jgi:sugar phosphate isomerase/epimerase
MKSNNIFKKGSVMGVLLLSLMVISCKETVKKSDEASKHEEIANMTTEPFFKLSLAQWSMHKMLFEGKMDPYSFAEKAKEWGFTGLEYVNQFYVPELKKANYSNEAMTAFVEKCNAQAAKFGMQNVLIMIDGEGGMAVPDPMERQKTIENHYKWVDAAAAMGCHAIRVNLYGTEDPVAWKANSVEALTKLATYAKSKHINILVENHGGLSSNGALLADVMKTVNMDNCGTLPDFGNFCIKRNADGSACTEEYDKYKGVAEMMPYAKAVSAKTHDFDANGNEVDIDYKKMLQIVKDAGYTGFIGVEYEGNEIGEEAGIIASRKLMLEAAKNLN